MTFVNDEQRKAVMSGYSNKKVYGYRNNSNSLIKQSQPTREFNVNPKIKMAAQSQRTQSGFRHVATLYLNGEEKESAKVTYQNRTWESYEFQTVLSKLVDTSTSLSNEEKIECKKYLAKDHTDWSEFKTISSIAKMGDIIGGDTIKEKNDWKARMLKAGLEKYGLEMPEDWESLDEKTKQERLNKIIKLLGEKHE
jgi:hypothetical protein